jgi:hypothetical protein
MSAAFDLFGNPVTPPLRVRLDRQIDRDRSCCDNVAIVGPGKAQHAAELRCAGCDAHRGWLPKQAFDFILETSRRHGAPAEITWRDRTIAIGDEKMSIEKKFDNGGLLFRNHDKETDKHPDYKGNLTVGGIEYWLNAWIKDGKHGKFMSLSVKPKEQRTAPAEELNDEIPF